MGVLVLESPDGPIEDVRELDGRIVVRGTTGFGITTGGAPFFDPSGDIPPDEQADLTLSASGQPQLTRRNP